MSKRHPLGGAYQIHRAIAEEAKATEPGQPAGPAILKRRIDVITMQDNIDVMKKYYSQEAWAKRRPLYERGPSPEWKTLYREVEAALGEDPASDRAQALAGRWIELSTRDSAGDPEMQAGGMKAWADRQNWPPTLKQRIVEYRLEELAAFIGKAVAAHRQKYYSEEAWTQLAKRTPEERAQISAEWHALFVEADSALADDPSSERAQHVATRWMQLAERSTQGQPDLRAGAVTAWRDRQHWPPMLRPSIAAFKLEEIVAFVQKAHAHRPKQPGQE